MKKTNIPNLVKDENSNLIINTNIGEYEKILATRKRTKDFLKMQKDIEYLKEKINFIIEKLGIKD